MNKPSFGKSISGGLQLNNGIKMQGRMIKRPQGLFEEKSTDSIKVYPASEPSNELKSNVVRQMDPRTKPVISMQSQEDLEVKEKAATTKAPNDYSLAETLINSHTIAIIENQVYLGNQLQGYFVGLAGNEADTLIRKCIPEKLKKYVSSKNIKEILNWFKTFDQLKVPDSKIRNRNFYVNFLNSVVDARDLSVHRKSLDYYFTSVINSNYPIDYHPTGTHFEKTMKIITGGNQSIYNLIQEVFGYILSEIRNLKHIIFFLGPKNCGKSLLINLLMELIGREFTSNLSLHDFNSQFRLSRLYRKKLNCYGETSEDTLSRLDILKAASGGDHLTGEFKYENCFEFINRAALLFAGNHLPKLKVIDQNNAFAERLLIIPFLNPIEKKDQDVHLLQKLNAEKPYICGWAINGLNRLIHNNYQFTKCEIVDEIQIAYSKSNNTLQMFVSDCCDLDPYLRSHTYELEEAYHDYCISIGEVPFEEKAFHNSLKSIPGISDGRFRIEGDNRNGYYGIALKEFNTEETCHE